MIRVLVTGSNGQLGKTLQDEVINYSDIAFHFTNKDTLDITKPQEVFRIFKKVNPEYCINCAAYTQVDQAEITPKLAYQVNVLGVENLVRACKNSNATLIQISTDYVFDGKKEEGYQPWDSPNPINIYGQTKLEAENIIRSQLERFYIVRTSWLYSKNHGHNFYKTILAKAKKGNMLTVTDQQKGCPTNAVNLAKFIMDLIVNERKDYGIKHFTDGKTMTWYDFARVILLSEGYRADKTLQRGENYRTFAERPRNSILKLDRK